ncbi:hypothetical protein [Mycoplasma nasistruthionis]|uniref:hypothetical protein n=1 Tax=Mycoplasma nasistruthionis TaxID=353852 RepID=UPI001C9E489C|nr:hypothetical protein [Mycoplasma nasistruthionis]
MIPEKTVIKADGKSLSYIQVITQDVDGVEYPWSNNLIHFDIKGAGRIVGVDNGDANSR